MKFLLKHGTTVALLLLCLIVSLLTIKEQNPVTVDPESAAEQVVRDAIGKHSSGVAVVVAGRSIANEVTFVAKAVESLREAGIEVVGQSNGTPVNLRAEFERLQETNTKVDLLIGTQAVVSGKLVDGLPDAFSNCANLKVYSPRSHLWPTFLTKGNLLNVANQISVTAILAVGMTFVIVAGGIDLSVGSLIALSSVICTILIRDHLGARDATTTSMILASLCAIGVCGLIGFQTGLYVEKLGVPPFIVTLAIMLIARGIAQILSEGEAVGFVPSTFSWLGRGTFLGIPNSVLLMLIVYVAAHILLSKTVLGRYIYAIGGNRDAAYLSGVPVLWVVVFTYAASGALAALGGVIEASSYESGSHTYGTMKELYVIAAVVVGGTSLAGGRGTIYGTLIGAFIIAVIRNGMNLTDVESFTQLVILGIVILAAVTLDKLKETILKAA